MSRCRSLPGLSGVALLICATGCGSGEIPTYPVKGRVLFPDGTALAGGRIELRSVGAIEGVNRVTARGIVAEDGTFDRLSTFQNGDGAVAGEHLVIIAPRRARVEGGAMFVPTIDRKFLNHSESGLRITVSEDVSKNDFELQVTPPAGR